MSEGGFLNKKVKIHFLSFASRSFRKSLERIKKEASDSGFFDTINCLTENDLPLSYRIRNIVVLNGFTRGYGYWIWKSYITKALLESIEPGDMIFYADAGCSINKEGKERFDQYVEMLEESSFSNLSFQIYQHEKEYSKEDLFKYFKVEKDNAIRNSGMLIGGVYLIQKDNNAIHLINEWYSICHSKTRLINDSISKYPNDPQFIEHRHDQSVFSLLRKLHGSLILKDETFFTDWDAKKQFPIHTRRLRK